MRLRKRWGGNSGQGAAEYALLVAAVVVVVALTTTLLGEDITELFNTIGVIMDGVI